MPNGARHRDVFAESPELAQVIFQLHKKEIYLRLETEGKFSELYGGVAATPKALKGNSRLGPEKEGGVAKIIQLLCEAIVNGRVPHWHCFFNEIFVAFQNI